MKCLSNLHAREWDTQTLAILGSARKLLADRERWTRKEWARDSTGRNCNAWADRACRWCLEGALIKTSADLGIEEWVRSAYTAMEAVNSCLPEQFDDCASFNDRESTTHTDILALLDRAIERVKLATLLESIV